MSQGFVDEDAIMERFRALVLQLFPNCVAVIRAAGAINAGQLLVWIIVFEPVQLLNPTDTEVSERVSL